MSEYVGKTYGFLTVVADAPVGHNYMKKVICKCDCGNVKEYFLSNLKRGHTISCGCHRKKATQNRMLKHGRTETRLYKVWQNIKERCNNPNLECFSNYGGRGIKLCKEWYDYKVFEKWAYENGYDESANYMQCTLDRINVNGDYCPENCRWVDAIKQCNNKRNNRLVTYEGKTHTVAEWARIKNINYVTLFCRLFKHGWSTEDAFGIPPIIGGKRNDLCDF